MPSENTPLPPLSLDCPKCKAQMHRRDYDIASAYRCESCQGLWFPMLEFEHLREDADVVDVGDPDTGARYNSIDRIQCPACKHPSPLVRMVDAQQPHIWFESCKFCYGRFFDAGEFRDFAEVTVEDFFKRFKVDTRY